MSDIIVQDSVYVNKNQLSNTLIPCVVNDLAVEVLEKLEVTTNLPVVNKEITNMVKLLIQRAIVSNTN